MSDNRPGLDDIRRALNREPPATDLEAARQDVEDSLVALQWMEATGLDVNDPGGLVREAHYHFVAPRLRGKPPRPDTSGMDVDGAVAALDDLLKWLDGQVVKPEPARKPSTRKKKKEVEIIQALMILQEHPDWPDARIAKEASVHASTLCRSQLYQKASTLVRGKKTDRPKGHVKRGEDGLRDVEAIDDPDPKD